MMASHRGFGEANAISHLLPFLRNLYLHLATFRIVCLQSIYPGVLPGPCGIMFNDVVTQLGIDIVSEYLGIVRQKYLQSLILGILSNFSSKTGRIGNTTILDRSLSSRGLGLNITRFTVGLFLFFICLTGNPEDGTRVV